MKKIVLILMVVFVAASMSFAAGVNVPSGVTGLWRFQNNANKLKATVGTDLVSVDEASTWYTGPWTVINPGLSDNGVVQEQSWGYLQVNPGLHANGGSSSYVNQYTVGIDYCQTNITGDNYNSLFQTASGGRDNDGDLFIYNDDGLTTSEIGIGDVGYSGDVGKYFDAGQWHRIMWSVDNGDDTGAGGFFRVYVDGQLFVDGAGQGRDGRMSLYPDVFNLFADDGWEDAWGLVGTAVVWDHALTGDEIAAMGDINTALTIPEPATMSLLALGGIALLRRNRK